MLPTIDRRPRYRQAADALAALLDSTYPAGSLLPPADQLAQQIGVSRSTLREAMGCLEHEGRLIRKQGVGTFTAMARTGILVNRLEKLSGLRSLAASAGLPSEVTDQDVTIQPATEEEAARVGLAPGAPVAHVRIVVSVGGRPVAFFDSITPAERITVEILAGQRQTLLEHLLSIGQPVPVYTDSRLFAIRANEEVARRLGVPPGAAVLQMKEGFHAADGRPVLYQHAYLLTDTIDYRIVRRITMRPGSWQNAAEAEAGAAAEVPTA